MPTESARLASFVQLWPRHPDVYPPWVVPGFGGGRPADHCQWLSPDPCPYPTVTLTLILTLTLTLIQGSAVDDPEKAMTRKPSDQEPFSGLAFKVRPKNWHKAGKQYRTDVSKNSFFEFVESDTDDKANFSPVMSH